MRKASCASNNMSCDKNDEITAILTTPTSAVVIVAKNCFNCGTKYQLDRSLVASG